MGRFRRLKSGKQYEALGTFGPYGVVPKNVKVIDANAMVRINVEHGTYLRDARLIKSAAENTA